MKPYHIKLVHKLSEDDFDRRVQFSEELLERLALDSSLLDRIIWSDEAIFTLSETVNRHNCVYWDFENPNIVKEIDGLGSEKVMVWVGLWSEGRTGPVFFNGGVTGQRYRQMLEDEVIPALILDKGEEYGSHFIFQQDGAPPHYSLTARELLHDSFDEWIGRRGPWEWPPRSPDLTTDDFFLWGYLKDKLFERGSSNLEDLKRVISEEFQKIPQEMIKKACRSVKERCELCIAFEGKQLKLHKG